MTTNEIKAARELWKARGVRLTMRNGIQHLSLIKTLEAQAAYRNWISKTTSRVWKKIS
jgi:hypothetical protein